MTFIPVTTVKSSGPVRSGRAPQRRLPSWFKVKIRHGQDYRDIRQIMDARGLHTICEEARCPNIWECWNKRTATFLILGDICTRRCHYCAVATGRPASPDENEPDRIGEAVQALGLRHAVITSVNRDDLADGGAAFFANTIQAIRHRLPSCTVEVLIPDFQGNPEALATVLQAVPDILNHNIETVPRLFPSIRPQGKYRRSLDVLRVGKRLGGRTKSGLMAGLGETMEELREVMRDLRGVGCDMLTIGQYLQPTPQHATVAKYYTPEEFQDLQQEGTRMGFSHVESGPLVRSSYHAEHQAKKIPIKTTT